MSKKISLIVLAITVVLGCAKRGHITGGEKDIYPPKVLKTYPDNFSTNFNAQEIIIQFDEFVKLKDVSKQLIISPPLKNKPEITPYSASKQIKIRLRDTLKPNTTYSLNFGQSIEDNNEGNKLQGYRYVFSTGSYIDSLSIKGSVKDALDKETESFVSVMLYEVNETFNDSIIYTENPRYITNTLDSTTTFALENIKEGKYLLIALKDKNNNNRFDPKHDKIGFYNKIISIPSDENYKLELFKEIPDYKPLRAFEAKKNKLTLAYEGKPENTKIELFNGKNSLETIITQVPEKDSLNVWYKSIDVDSLLLNVHYANTQKSFNIKLKEKISDSLALSLKSSKRLGFRDNVTFLSATPLVVFDSTKIQLLNKDSLTVSFSTKYDAMNQNLEFLFEKEEKQRYYLTMFPGSVTDFFGQTNDTIKADFSTQNYSDFGNLKIILQNVKEFPVIIQLTDDKGNVQVEYYSVEETEIEFFNLNPNMYTLRVIYDRNSNKIWDTGNFLKKIQPEKVVYFPDKIDVRANWDVEQIFILRD